MNRRCRAVSIFNPLITGNNSMRFFREGIFGPVIGVTTFKDEAEALALANDSEFGLGLPVYGLADVNRAIAWGVLLRPGAYGLTVTISTLRTLPSGYKNSGVGRETHKVALSHYQQVKNLLVSYDSNRSGCFNLLSNAHTLVAI